MVARADGETDSTLSTVWVVDVDGGAPAPLTDGPYDTSPRWSPDGAWLAFLSRRPGEYVPQLAVVPVGGGEARRLAEAPSGAFEPAWSPDGGRLAFLRGVDPLGPPDPTRPVACRTLPTKADGIGVTGSRRLQLFVVALDGELRQLTEGDRSAGRPSWSPDGRLLAFSSAPAVATGPGLPTRVALVPADGSASASFVTEALDATVSFPTFLADGESLLATRWDLGRVGLTRLVRVALDGGAMEDLMPGFDRNVIAGGPGMPLVPPRPAADGRVLFLGRDGGCLRLYADGEPVAGSDEVSVLGFGVAGDAVATVEADAGTCGEVAVGRLDGPEPFRRLTAMVADALDDVALVAPKPRTFTASDGGPVPAWVLRGDGAGAGADGGPLLVDLHGGPHYGWGPTFEGVFLYQQVLAAAGWTVVLPNPRGSDGYGAAFMAALVDQGWGVADEGDVSSVVDALVDEGTADPARVAVTGYSYGGYFTCWLTARTDRFAAAVAGGVVADMASWAGTVDVGPGMVAAEVGALPWDDPDRLRALSPITHVADVTTPTLLLHGEADDRCPIGQAEQWFAALVSQGREAELVRYPGAAHGFLFAGRPSHRVDYNRRLLDWLHRWVLED